MRCVENQQNITFRNRIEGKLYPFPGAIPSRCLTGKIRIYPGFNDTYQHDPFSL
jgi:hypothetical protein